MMPGMALDKATWVDNRARTLAFWSLAVLVAAAIGVLVAADPAHAATTFAVNSTADTQDANLANAACDANASVSGNQCTLRAAIQEANDTSGADVIRFNIPDNPNVAGLEVKTISPTRALPIITEALTINGYTQPGASVNTLATGNNTILKIQLNGTNTADFTSGLEIEASNSTIRGLVINRFAGDGVLISGSGATNRVLGNFLGTNAAGTAALGNGEDGVDISVAENNNTVGGTAAAARNVISGNQSDGIQIAGGGGNNKVLGNFIGTNASGTNALGNLDNGVNLSGDFNTVGGTEEGARNVISGNSNNGVRIAFATNTEVLRNFIGTNARGTAAVANSGNGVLITRDASANTIGGTDAVDGALDGVVKARNVISGNNENGVLISGTGATGNSVQGNFVGTTADGTVDLGNTRSGVSLSEADDNTIGGTTAGARNVISGNNENGVAIFGDSTGNEVQGNRIGTKADGTGDLGNGNDGVSIITTNDNTVGGTDAGAGNAISGNGRHGVFIFGGLSTGNEVKANGIRANDEDGVNITQGSDNAIGGGNAILANGDNGVEVSSGSKGNSILSNQIFGNAGLGIDLVGGTENGFGVTANDNDDPDTGANNRQNFPVIASATRGTTFPVTTTIQGTLNSNPGEDFTVQCFLADGDSSGHGEGEKLAGQDTAVTTDANGNASFTCTTFVATQVGRTAVTATATNTATGDTSEFSENVVVSSGR